MSNAKTYFAEYTPFLDAAAREARLAEISSDRRERIARAGSPETQAEILASGLILNAAAKDAGLSQFEVAVNEYGKPDFVGNGLHFNLSHSHGVVCCTIADTDVGVDIEKIDAPHDMMRIADRFFSPYEYGAIQMSAVPAEAFCRLWTLRESYVKMRGMGFAIGLSSLRCDFHRGECTMFVENIAQTDAVFHEFRNIYGYRGSVCTKGDVTHDVRRITL